MDDERMMTETERWLLGWINSNASSTVPSVYRPEIPLAVCFLLPVLASAIDKYMKEKK